MSGNEQAKLVVFIDPRIAKATAGDKVAAQQLLKDILPRVRNLVRYLVRGDVDVDDMTQQALLAVLRGLPTFRAEGKWLSWVDRITAREALAYQKKKRNSQRKLHAYQEDLSVLQENTSARSEYMARRDLARRLDQLPEAQRNVVVLHHVVGMTVPELSEHLKIPFETAKSRLRLGMKKLRELRHET